MSFRKMLIKIDSPEHFEAVQKKLFELGFTWAWTLREEKTLWQGPCEVIRCASDGLLWLASEDYYHAEYPHLPWVDILTEQQQKALEPVKPPIGLMPRSVFEATTRQQRAKDILAAMQRYAEAGEAVPVEWIDELKELVC